MNNTMNTIKWKKCRANHGTPGGQDPMDYRSQVISHCGNYRLRSWDVEHGPGRYWVLFIWHDRFAWQQVHNKGYKTLADAKAAAQQVADVGGEA